MKCLHPVHTKLGTFRCGKCLACKAQKVNEYIIRFNAETDVSASTFFLTLTYANDHLPPFGVSKTQVQRFLTRLKNVFLPNTHFKYVAIAEYGGRYYRPHYHFNLWFDNHVDWWYLCDKIKELWSEPSVDWSTIELIGRVDLKEVKDKETNYVAKYHATNILSDGIYRIFNTPYYVNHNTIEQLKRSKGQFEIAKGVFVDSSSCKNFILQSPVFRLSSHGIGESWLQSEEFFNTRSKGDYKIVNNRGQQCSIPRYYVRKMSESDKVRNSCALIDYMISREDDEVDRMCKEYEQSGLIHEEAYRIALDRIGKRWYENYKQNVINRKSHGNENASF